VIPTTTRASARQLNAFLRRFSPEVRRTAQAALRALRAQVPGATEMVYDKANALVIGFAPRDRPSEAILSIALYTKWVNLYFLDGVLLSDPNGLLQGTGNRVRMLRLDDVKAIESPAVRTLIAEAVRTADAPFNRKSARRIVIRQRRPPAP
jgi:hypothetical protein